MNRGNRCTSQPAKDQICQIIPWLAQKLKITFLLDKYLKSKNSNHVLYHKRINHMS